LFQAGHVSKPTDDNTSSPAEQQSMSEQALVETQNLVAAGQATDESDEGKSNAAERSAEKISIAEGQSVLTSCSATLSSNVSSDTVASVRTEQTDSASNVSDLAKTSKGVVIRPVTTTSESNGKEYEFLNLYIE